MELDRNAKLPVLEYVWSTNLEKYVLHHLVIIGAEISQCRLHKIIFFTFIQRNKSSFVQRGP